MSSPLSPLRDDLGPAAERVSGQPDRVLCRSPKGELLAWLEVDWRRLVLADGTLTAAALARRATAAGLPTTALEVEALFRKARQEGLLRDRRVRPAGPLALLEWRPLEAHDATLPLRVLPEARYRCEQCGESCAAGYEVGPVPRPLPIAEGETVPCPAAGGPLPHLRRQDGICGQLDPRSGLCRIHAEAGFYRKPRACREFPLLLCRTPLELRLALQWECTRLHRSLTLAPPLAASLEASPVGLLAAFAPDALPLGDGRLLPFARYAQLEACLLPAVASGSPDRVALGLPHLVAALSRRVDPKKCMRQLEERAPLDLAEELVLEASTVIEALYRQGRAMAPVGALLAPDDRRRLYRAWLEAVLERWRAGGRIELPPMDQLELWRAYLRNRLFGLGLLKAPSLFAGAVDVALRYLIARAGASIPLPVPPEGSPGDAENRRLVAVEHSLREERMAPVLAAEAEALEDWLDRCGAD